MRTIKEYAKRRNLYAVPIRYHVNGIYLRRKGYDLCSAKGSVLVTIEPEYSTDGTKWMIYGRNAQAIRRYVKRITPKVLAQFDDVQPSGFINLFAVYLHSHSPELREVNV